MVLVNIYVNFTRYEELLLSAAVSACTGKNYDLMVKKGNLLCYEGRASLGCGIPKVVVTNT